MDPNALTRSPDTLSGAPAGGSATAGLDGTPNPTARVPAPAGYELLDEIGAGGMGLVYRARDVALNRHVALKVLHPRYPADGPTARRFVDEAGITGQLQHPGIPPVHQVGTLPDGRPFLAMKLIKGRTLEEQLRRRGAPADDRGRLLAVFEQVCQAVAFAHDHRVIHRDLKPSNVMVGAFAEVQVVDWGLAKSLAAARPAEPPTEADEEPGTEVRSLRGLDSATVAGSVLGTPAFMPPEQAGGEVERVDARSDVFGLGAILAVILTGKPPYAADTPDAVRLMAIRGQLGECLARLDGCGAEPELVALCRRCLAADPAARPADAGAVADAVAGLRAAADERARQAELDRVRAEGEARAADVRAAEQRKRRQVQAALGLAFTALVVLGGAFAWWAQEQRQRREADDLRQANERAADARERRAAAEREVLRALEDAVASFGRASGAGSDPRLWAEARAAAAQAQARAGAADAPPEARDRVRGLLAEIDQLERNRRLVAALLEIQAGMGDVPAPDGNQDFAGTDARYARAFREYGTDLLARPPADAAEVLRGLAGGVRVELAAAIDDWGYVNCFLSRRLDLTARLFEVTRLLDPDPTRNRIRDAVAAQHAARVAVALPWGGAAAVRYAALARTRADLTRLTAEIDPAAHPVQTINLVSVYLWHFGAGGDTPGRFLLAAHPHHPNDFQINHNLGFFLTRAGRPAAALPYCTAALAVRPRSGAAWQQYGGALAAAGRTGEAIDAFRRALAVAPRSEYARRRLNELVAASDRLAALRAAVARAPRDARARHDLALAMDGAGDPAGALAEMRVAAGLDPQNVSFHDWVATLLLARDDPWGALPEAREAVRLGPTYARGHFNLGRALLATDDPGGAAAAFEEALRRDPKYPAARQWLAFASRQAPRPREVARPPGR